MISTYIKPETKVFKIDLQQIMSGSTHDVSDSTPIEWGAKGFNFFEEDFAEDEE